MGPLIKKKKVFRPKAVWIDIRNCELSPLQHVIARMIYLFNRIMLRENWMQFKEIVQQAAKKSVHLRIDYVNSYSLIETLLIGLGDLLTMLLCKFVNEEITYFKPFFITSPRNISYRTIYFGLILTI